MTDAETAKAQFTQGLNFLDANDFANAEARFRATLALLPQSAPTLTNLAIALLRQGKVAEARDFAERALAIDANKVDALLALANCLAAEKKYTEAVAACDRIVAIDPGIAEVHGNRGLALSALCRFEDALASYDRAVALAPNFAVAHAGRGNMLAELVRPREAVAAFDRALALNADQVQVWFRRGNACFELRNFGEAIASYDRALALKPNFADAWLGRANALVNSQHYEQAIAAYDKALAAEPGLNYAEGLRLFAKLQICDWSGYAQDRERVLAGLKAGARVAQPFDTIVVACSPADQLTCARLFAAYRFPAPPHLLARDARYAHDRIRIAYLSADFHAHATAYLLAGVFEQHDRRQFEITALSYGPDDGSGIRARVRRAFDRFIDVRDKSDLEVARLMREHEIDIAVDLMGYVAESRPGIMLHRGAPVQVNYLGFPGTTGADCIDYIIADRIVIPEEERSDYSEAVVYLPDCYQANDDKRPIADAMPLRADAGLPEKGFVFCSFNNSFKIVPEIFDIWMRLLAAFDDSVLWLFAGHPAVPGNLRREAEKRGIRGERLVFAPRVPLADHLARQRLADLFLDTVPCNAHTTASDALRAGLPVLTCIGTNFAGRVAASVLNAAGMPELVTQSLADYEAMAVKLARDHALLASFKERLARTRESCPLFDTERFTRHLEAAYQTMWERLRLQQAPVSFAVEPKGGAS